MTFNLKNKQELCNSYNHVGLYDRFDDPNIIWPMCQTLNELSYKIKSTSSNYDELKVGFE